MLIEFAQQTERIIAQRPWININLPIYYFFDNRKPKQYQQYYLMINFQPITYSINNLPYISPDIEKRTYYLRKAATLLERKADMDMNYASILDNLINKDYVKPTQNQIPSQYIYKNLISILQQDARRMKRLGESLKAQSGQFQRLLDQQCPQVLRTLNAMKSISKELTSQREKLERSRIKFQKRSKQLQQAKIQHMSSLLGSDQRQSTNELYLQVSSLEDSISPLRQDYKGMSFKYNDLVEVSVEQFKVMLSKLQMAEMHKINGLKVAVTSYLQVQKDTLNQILHMDSVRERDELQPHNEDIINQQRIQMLLPYCNELQYIDCIYDRISVKKNLEQIILYGDRDHKRSINDAFNCQREGKTLNAKTLRIVQIFRSAFQDEVTGQMLGELKGLLSGDQKLRKDFMQCLQKYRINNEFCLRLPNKSTILQSLQIFLNSCDAELDTYNSKMLMILSLTYHFEEDGRKTELQQLISSHFIWKRIGWWQSALLQSIFQQTRVKVKKQKVPITAWDIKAGGVSFKQEGEQITYQHICFNQLLYYIRNMGLFHLPPQSILQYARDNIKLLKFTGNFAKDIIDLCPQLSPQR